MSLEAALALILSPERPTKPVDLILANQLHIVASRLEQLPADKLGEVLAHPDCSEMLARDFLIGLSRAATADNVFAAISAAGGPSTPAEMIQRLRAVLDSRAKPKPVTP